MVLKSLRPLFVYFILEIVNKLDNLTNGIYAISALASIVHYSLRPLGF